MPENDAGADRGDAELRIAVRRLLAMKDWALKHPGDVISRAAGGRFAGAKNEDVVRECFNSPLWHRVEEMLK